MPFCLQCGSPAHRAIPTGDSKERLVCTSCDYIHYENPKMICGALAVYDDKILLCQRAIEPRYGLWTLPAGFMEIGETMQEGAMRETTEEACATITNAKLYCLFDIPVLGQIHAMYLANLQDGQYGVGTESLACQLVDPAHIPWKHLAFKTISQTLQLYLQDKAHLKAQGLDSTDFTLYPLRQICISAHR
ncbi:MAG: NUDIX hydrolase [Moraxella sp.]|nr:NUDIX hydrolase [Moraxella sp.]